MKTTYIITITSLLFLFFTTSVQAQRGFIKRQIEKKIERDLEEKYDEAERERNKNVLEDGAYENDKRYSIPENPIQATLIMQTQTFKRNGELDDTMTIKLLFGKTGECMVMNEGEKNETRMLFDYIDAATYVMNEKEKTAMKMPMMNLQKMAENMSGNQTDIADDPWNPINTEDNNSKWTRTNMQKDKNGYKCRKYVYLNTKEKTKIDAWFTQDISLDLSGNHLFGGQLKNFSSDSSSTIPSNLDENFPRGMMVQSIYFDTKRDTPTMQTDITTFKKSSNPEYFDLSEYEINDSMGKF